MKVSKRTLIYMFFLYTWLPAHAIYALIPGGYKLLLYLRLFTSVYILISHFGEMKRATRYFLVAGYSIINIASTVLHNTTRVSKWFDVLEFCLCLVAMLLFFQSVYCSDRSDRDKLRKAVLSLLFLYTIGTLISCFTMAADDRTRQGVYFFVDSRANTAQILMTLNSMLLVLDMQLSGKTRRATKILFALCFICMIGLKSGQGIMMMGVEFLCAFMLLTKRDKKVTKLLSPAGVLILSAGLNYLVVSQVYLRFEPIVFFIENVLRKEASLTGRDLIFQSIGFIYLQSPWIGFGYENTIVSNALGSISAAYNSAHNSLFQILIEVGAIGFVFYLGLIYVALKGLYKRQTKDMMIAYGAICAFIIGGLVSLSCFNVYFWVFLAFALTNESCGVAGVVENG